MWRRLYCISEKKLTIIVAATTQLIMQLVANMTVIALPDIIIDLNFSAETILWVNLIYLMSFVAFSIPFSKIITRYGVKKSISISLIGLFVSIILSVLALNDYMFLFSRLIQGLISASLAICLYVMIVEELPEDEMGSALGIVASSGYVGMLIAPSFMGFISLLNWRYAFLILVPIVALLLFLLSRIDNEWYTDKKPIDNIGSLLYVIAMAFFTYGITTLDEYGIIPVIISLILLILFIKVEKRVEEPIYNLKLMKNMK